MWFRLNCQAPALGDYEFAVDELPVVVGRSKTADVSLPNALISRHHCEFAASELGVVLRDLDSTNGTIVNDMFVEEHVLVDGDVLELGDFSLRVELGPELKYQADLNLVSGNATAD